MSEIASDDLNVLEILYFLRKQSNGQDVDNGPPPLMQVFGKFLKNASRKRNISLERDEERLRIAKEEYDKKYKEMLRTSEENTKLHHNIGELQTKVATLHSGLSKNWTDYEQMLRDYSKMNQRRTQLYDELNEKSRTIDDHNQKYYRIDYEFQHIQRQTEAIQAEHAQKLKELEVIEKERDEARNQVNIIKSEMAQCLNELRNESQEKAAALMREKTKFTAVAEVFVGANDRIQNLLTTLKKMEDTKYAKKNPPVHPSKKPGPTLESGIFDTFIAIFNSTKQFIVNQVNNLLLSESESETSTSIETGSTSAATSQ